jgi:protein-disulfide isomerase
LGLLAGVRQSGSRLGKSSAPVTLTLYGDLECVLCKQLVLGRAFSKLITHDVRAGGLQIRYVAFRTATPTRSVFVKQQVAALAAGRQQRFWQYVMLFLSHQATESTQYVTESFLDDLAHQVPGLNFARWQAARQVRTLAAQVRSDDRSASRHGISGTPTLIFHGRRGNKTVQTPFPDYGQLEHAIIAVS